MDLIKNKFYKKATIRGGILLFDITVAIDVIMECKKLHKKILGIDSFKIKERTTQPLLENSIDFSEKNSGNWDEAISFLQKLPHEELLFEIVYE